MDFLAFSRPIFYLILLSFYIAGTESTGMTALYAISLAFFLTTSAIIVGWLRLPKRWGIAALYGELLWSTVLGTLAAIYDPGGPMPALFCTIFVSLFFDLPSGWIRPTLTLTALLWLLTFIAMRGEPSVLFQIGLYGAFHLFSAAMGSLMRNLRDEKERSEELLVQVQESQAALATAHQQLKESATRQQELAVLEERHRMAREIHDSVAHSLTALVVQLQAARRLINRAPQRSTEDLAHCEEMARQALLETRLAVRALRPDGFSQQGEVDALERLGREFGAATGMQVTIEADGNVRSLPPDPNRLEQLYRIFQEALTNARRHGQAHQVEAQLSLVDGLLLFRITNHGLPPENLEPGVGLRSMTERAQSLGGSVQFEPLADGLVVQLLIPVEQEASL